MIINYDSSAFQKEVRKNQAPPSTVIIVYSNGRGLDIFRTAFCVVTDQTQHNRAMRFFHVTSIEGRNIIKALSNQVNSIRINDFEYTLVNAYASIKLKELRQKYYDTQSDVEQFIQDRIKQIESTSTRQDASIYDQSIWHAHNNTIVSNSLVKVTLHIPGLHSDDPKPLKAKLCPTCGDIFIHYDNYQMFTIKNGPPDFRLNDLRYTRSDSIWKVDVNLYSKLSLYGYDVREEGLGCFSQLRQRYLSDLIEANLLTKEEIKKHLAFLVRMGKKNPIMKDYVPDWENDLSFINSMSDSI